MRERPFRACYCCLPGDIGWGSPHETLITIGDAPLRETLGAQGYRRLVEEHYEGDVAGAARVIDRVAEILAQDSGVEEQIQNDPAIRDAFGPYIDAEDLPLLLLIDFPWIYFGGDQTRDQIDPQQAAADYGAIRADTNATEVLAHWLTTFEWDAADNPLSDASAFSAGRDIRGYEDGYYPPMLQNLAERLLPEDVLRAHGEYVGGMVSGTWYALDPNAEESLVQELQGRGFECLRDDELIKTASGHG